MGSTTEGLDRFVKAQSAVYAGALAEVKAGQKQSHWMWFIFPQVRGLGSSSNADYFGISGLVEARAYLDHSVLGHRLYEITNALLDHNERSAREIFGEVDTMKLKSSMTLFDLVCPQDVFARALTQFFAGERDELTLKN
jgi:uncharacterized protein (DUF1810 family)